MKDITQIVADIVDSMTYYFNSLTSTEIDGSYKLTTINTYWLFLNQDVVIGGNLYRIIEIQQNEYIVLKPELNTYPNTGLIFTIPKPTYKYGTARAINEELSTFTQSKKRFVLWLYAPTTIKRIREVESRLHSITPVKLFLFAEANTDSWVTDQHYDNVLRPISVFFELFYDKIIENVGLFSQPYEDIDYDYLPDWGEFNDIKGFESRIFDEKWSGIKATTRLNILNQPCYL